MFVEKWGGSAKIPGCTWHHHDCKTMQLVPTALHQAISHTGGDAIVRAIGELR